MTPALSEELTYCQGLTQQPLLDKLRSLRAALPAAGTSPEALRPLMAGIRLICRIFYSLNSLGLTDVRVHPVPDTWLRLRPAGSASLMQCRTSDHPIFPLSSLVAARAAVAGSSQQINEVREKDAVFNAQVAWQTHASAADCLAAHVVQVFADQLDAWMEEFHGMLNFQTAALPESDPEKETLPDAVSGLPRAPGTHTFI